MALKGFDTLMDEIYHVFYVESVCLFLNVLVWCTLRVYDMCGLPCTGEECSVFG